MKMGWIWWFGVAATTAWLVQWCSTSKVALLQTFSYSEKNRKTHSRKKKNTLGIDIEWKCRVYRALGVYPDILMHHLVNPGFLLGFGNPPSLFTNYLRKRYPKKTTTPQKNLNHSGNFSTSNPGISAPTGGEFPPPGGSRSRRAWRQNTPPPPGHNLQRLFGSWIDPGKNTNWGKAKTNMFFYTQEMGKKSPFFKWWWKTCVEALEFLVSTDSFGDLSCVQPIGVFDWVFSFYFGNQRWKTLGNTSHRFAKNVRRRETRKSRM